jgi:hypothetical protein
VGTAVAAAVYPFVPSRTAPPADVVDCLLWRNALQVKERHRPDGAVSGCCGAAFPCTPARLAARAEQASCVGGHEAHTARVDAQSADAAYRWTERRPVETYENLPWR